MNEETIISSKNNVWILKNDQSKEVRIKNSKTRTSKKWFHAIDQRQWRPNVIELRNKKPTNQPINWLSDRPTETKKDTTWRKRTPFCASMIESQDRWSLRTFPYLFFPIAKTHHRRDKNRVLSEMMDVATKYTEHNDYHGKNWNNEAVKITKKRWQPWELLHILPYHIKPLQR